METERRDDVNHFYNNSSKIRFASKVILYLNIIVSFLILNDIKCVEAFIICAVILNISYVSMTFVNEMIFTNYAENQRRKSMIKDGLNVDITLLETNKYYNNQELPSIRRLGLNGYESAFFTSELVKKMMTAEVIKTTTIVIIYLVMMMSLDNLNLILVVTQTIFSAEFIFSTLKLSYYNNKLNHIISSYQQVYFVDKSPEKIKNVVILDLVMEYESLKNYCKIDLSSRLFRKYNPVFTKQWDAIISNLNKQSKKK